MVISRLTRPPTNRRHRTARDRLTDTGRAVRERAQAMLTPGAEQDEGSDAEYVPAPRLMLARIGAAVAALVCIALGVGVALSFNQYTARTQRFVVSEFEVQGNLRVSDAQVIEASGVEAGAPLLGVQREQARQRIEALPWVARAEVQAILPSRLVIRVEEHQPVAMVADGDLWLVDRDGLIFKPVEAGSVHDLPLITGIPMSALRPGAVDKAGEMAVQRGLLNTALGMLQRVATSPLSGRMSLSEIHWDPVQGITLVSAADGAEWRVGHREGEELDRILSRLARLHAHLQARHERLRYALMDDTRRPDRAVVHAVPADAPMLLAFEGVLQKVGGAANARAPRGPREDGRARGDAAVEQKTERTQAHAQPGTPGALVAGEDNQAAEEPVLGD